MAKINWNCPACSKKLRWNQRFGFGNAIRPRIAACPHCGASLEFAQNFIKWQRVAALAFLLLVPQALLPDDWQLLANLIHGVAALVFGIWCLCLLRSPLLELALPEDES